MLINFGLNLVTTPIGANYRFELDDSVHANTDIGGNDCDFDVLDYCFHTCIIPSFQNIASPRRYQFSRIREKFIMNPAIQSGSSKPASYFNPSYSIHFLLSDMLLSLYIYYRHYGSPNLRNSQILRKSPRGKGLRHRPAAPQGVSPYVSRVYVV